MRQFLLSFCNLERNSKWIKTDKLSLLTNCFRLGGVKHCDVTWWENNQIWSGNNHSASSHHAIADYFSITAWHCVIPYSFHWINSCLNCPKTRSCVCLWPQRLYNPSLRMCVFCVKGRTPFWTTPCGNNTAGKQGRTSGEEASHQTRHLFSEAFNASEQTSSTEITWKTFTSSSLPSWLSRRTNDRENVLVLHRTRESTGQIHISRSKQAKNEHQRNQELANILLKPNKSI